MTNEEIIKEIQDGSDLMLDLYVKNKKLLYKVANRYTWGADIDDLMQTAYLALRDAAFSYDIERGVLFSSYAVRCIQSQLLRYVENNKLLAVPSHRQQQARKLDKITGYFETTEGRTATDHEACALMGCDKETLKEIRAAKNAEPISIESPLADGCTIADTIPAEDNTEDILDKIENEQLHKALKKEIKTLSPAQQKALKDRYWNNKTFAQLGRKQKSEHDKAIRILRQPKHRKMLKRFTLYGDSMRNVGAGTFLRTWTSATEREAIKLY